MHLPRWFLAMVGLVGLNVVLVGWSVAGRHLLASASGSSPVAETDPADNSTGHEPVPNFADESTPESSERATSVPAAPTVGGLQERLEQLEAPPIDQQLAPPVAADDPLLREIRQQLSDQFPDWTKQATADPSSLAPHDAGESYRDIPLIRSQQAIIHHLNQAARQLVELAEQQRGRQQHEAAGQT